MRCALSAQRSLAIWHIYIWISKWIEFTNHIQMTVFSEYINPTRRYSRSQSVKINDGNPVEYQPIPTWNADVINMHYLLSKQNSRARREPMLKKKLKSFIVIAVCRGRVSANPCENEMKLKTEFSEHSRAMATRYEINIIMRRARSRARKQSKK